MSIANDMVLAMFGEFRDTVKSQRDEIEKLTNRVHELEDLLTEVKSEWNSPAAPLAVHGSDTAVPSETRVMCADPFLDSVLE